MTKLKITLLLPEKANTSKAKKSQKINCGGVIVRAGKSAQAEYYNTAIFFDQIRDKDRSKLEDYIQHHLATTAQKT